MQMPRFARHDPGAELIAERQDFLFRYVLPRYRGRLAWLAGNAYHLYKLVGLKKQVQVFLDWALADVFPRDASMVRKPRECKSCRSRV
jgi:hypothetical protein